MSVDELRVRLAAIAETVVPDADPYTRLVRQARRRRWHRVVGRGGAVAALLATALVGPTVLGVGGHSDGPHDPSLVLHGSPVDSPWTWRLINSPTRGSLADDRDFAAQVTRLFDRERDSLHVSADLPDVKLLYADDSAGYRRVVLAFHSDTHAALVTRQAPVGASPRSLLAADGEANDRINPFTVLTGRSGLPGDQEQWVLGLGPTGCDVSYSRSASVSGGEVRRNWEPSSDGDWLLLDQRSTRTGAQPGWWRVRCDGQVREQRPIAPLLAATGETPADPDLPPDARPSPAPTIADWRVPRDAGRAYRTLTQISDLIAPQPVIRWAGRLDPDDETESVLVGRPGAGPLLLQIGVGERLSLPLTAVDREEAHDDTETPTTGGQQAELVATGIASTDDLAAVRVTARSGSRTVPTDRLLVVPVGKAARVEAVAGGQVRAGAPVRGGAALLTLPVGSTVTLRVLDGTGGLLTSTQLSEPAGGERIFGELLVSDW